MASVYAPNVVINLVPETCCNCGVHFAMDERYWDEKKLKGGTFYCPNGHGQHYTEPEVQKLKQRVRSLENANRWTEQRLESERRSHSATKGQLTKTRKRVAHGVCPCCNRTFQQLSRHMQNKHPEYIDGSR
jgi:hypothetical protein